MARHTTEYQLNNINDFPHNVASCEVPVRIKFMVVDFQVKTLNRITKMNIGKIIVSTWISAQIYGSGSPMKQSEEETNYKDNTGFATKQLIYIIKRNIYGCTW